MSVKERIRNETLRQSIKRTAIRTIPKSLQPIARDTYHYLIRKEPIVYPRLRSLDLAGNEIFFIVHGPYENRLISYLQSEGEYINWMCEVVQGKTVWCIGEAEGAHTISSYLHEAKKVLAFEPDGENRQALEKNIRLNIGSPDNIIVLPFAVWTEDAVLTMQTSGREGKAPKILHNSLEGGYKKLSEVHAFSLPTLSETYGKPDIIKLDIEGSEFEVLPTLSQMSDLPEHIFLEVHLDSEVHIKRAYELGFVLTRLGYQEVGGYTRGTEYLVDLKLQNRVPRRGLEPPRK